MPRLCSPEGCRHCHRVYSTYENSYAERQGDYGKLTTTVSSLDCAVTSGSVLLGARCSAKKADIERRVAELQGLIDDLKRL